MFRVALLAAVALVGCRRAADDVTPRPAPPPAPVAVSAAVADAAAPSLPDAGADASYADLGQLDPRFLDGVTVETAKVVDARDLGHAIDVRVALRVSKANPGLPVLEVLLVLSGTRTIAVDIGHTWDLGTDEDTPAGSLILVGAEEPPRTWSAQGDPGTARLPSRQPMFYRFDTSSPHLVDSFAIVREKDALVAFTFFIDEGEAADGWEKAATITLPRGATLRFP